MSEAITKIEERKKTSEYEGFIKEGQATGYLDVDSAICIERVGTLVGPGGVIDKNEQNTIASKVLVGDNRGQVTLLDVSRKTILDKFPVPHLEGRRIVSLSSFSIEWVGTQLTYVAVVARGSPIVSVLIFKHNENKIRLLYTINTLPAFEHPYAPESVDEVDYKNFPIEAKYSLDGIFMAVTIQNGSI